jgi:nucleotide-binding universal stress UspA family protein
MTVIVVGVDHSAGAKAALRFALEEARLRQATLRAIHAIGASYPILGEELVYPVYSGGLDELRSAAQTALDATLEEVASGADGVEIERRVVEGAAAWVLVDESRDAELLVVGSRGLGGFAGLLLGSVSQQCAHHAACPVVIVRALSRDPG